MSADLLLDQLTRLADASDAQKEIAELESRLASVERELAALRWAIGATPGLAELDENFRNRDYDPTFRS